MMSRAKSVGAILCAIFLVLMGVILIERGIRADLGFLVDSSLSERIDPESSVRQVEFGKVGSDNYVLVEFETGERVFYFDRMAIRLNDREP